MRRDTRLLATVWLATAAIVAVGSLLAYHFLTRVDTLAGRHDPTDLFEDPTLLFTDPGILGTAVEVRVTEVMRACMANAGYDFRGPAVLSDLDALLDPAVDGYGIAVGPRAPRPRLGEGGPGGTNQAGYEEALYGSTLSGAGDAAPGGCVAAGRAALDAALASLGSMPYPIERLQADAVAHPAWVAGLEDWSVCMAERGFSTASPNDLIAAQAAALALASGEAARAVGDQERAAAIADFACRESNLDPALDEVAADLAPVFVSRNRVQLEALLPSSGEPPADQGLGTGDVQVTLRWGSLVDLDLAVTDPSGASIDYANPLSSSGGQLDRDANYPCSGATTGPVENIYWPPAGAPQGHYVVSVHYRTGCGQDPGEPFELVIRLDGEIVQELHRTIDPASPLTFEFDYGDGQ